MKKKLYDSVEQAWKKAIKGRCMQEKTHWINTTGNATETVMTYARYFDLVLMGQTDKDDQGLPMVGQPDLVALKSGSPVMVIPRDFNRGPVNGSVVLAWDGTRAAARAMADAVHFLEEVSVVTVLTVGESTPAQKARQDVVATHLSRHGIDTKLEMITNSKHDKVSIGEVIVNYCEQMRPDVLVMGAYEHSKFREDYFGGVTNTVLKNLTIPVFMSH